jgi:hypothetical protein
MLDTRGNIIIPKGDTFTLRIELTGMDFTGADRVVVAIKDAKAGRTYHKKALCIEAEDDAYAAYWNMSSPEAKAIPVGGTLIWSFTVYVNFRESEGGYEGDEVITPLGGTRTYSVKEVASDGR